MPGLRVRADRSGYELARLCVPRTVRGKSKGGSLMEEQHG